MESQLKVSRLNQLPSPEEAQACKISFLNLSHPRTPPPPPFKHCIYLMSQLAYYLFISVALLQLIYHVNSTTLRFKDRET